MPGHVYLIGAGPGDPTLITVRGARCLERSDIVLYDGLIDPQMLQFAVNSEHVCVGKHGQARIWTQDEIIDEMLKLARSGKVVARLKGGDPAVFARAAEEADALADAGISFEIVPGITAALAAGSYAGVPITHREHASAVALVTGQQQDHNANPIDWSALAQFPGTLVVYMGITSAPVWTEKLLAAGKSPDTPVAIVRRCSWPDQQVVRCSLAQVTATINPTSGAKPIRPPAIVILGSVADLPKACNWFGQRPLLGRCVLVTRARDQNRELAHRLQELGADVLQQPAIEIISPPDWSEVDSSIHRLDQFDWIVMSSRNGVQHFLNRVLEIGKDMRCLGGCRIAAVGQRTAQALADFGLKADLVPEDFRAESLAHALAGKVDQQSVLSIRANRGRDVLPNALTQAGAKVTQVVAYHQVDVIDGDQRIGEMLSDEKIDFVTVTSSAIARSLVAMYGQRLRHTRLASLSPITSQTLSELGYQASVQAQTYTMDGLVAAIENAAADQQ